MDAPVPKEVSPVAGDGRGASSQLPDRTCPSCWRPQPPPLADLPTQLLELLDRDGPTSARRLADELHRRDASIRGALHELAAAGFVRLEQPTRSPRSRRWAAVSEPPGRAWDAHETADGSYVAVLSAVGGLAALVAADELARSLALGGLFLLAAAVVLAWRRAEK